MEERKVDASNISIFDAIIGTINAINTTNITIIAGDNGIIGASSNPLLI